jgi:prepilin-type N-terminal cleavage/methylation domain-containing protein
MIQRLDAFRCQRGFTFIELSFVMIVLGLVAAVLAQVVPAMRRSSMTAETVRNISSVQLSLESFAAIHGRLPCADTDNDGVENATPCQTIGTLPYVTLGYPGALANADGYDFKYALYQRDDPTLRQQARLGEKTERYRPSTGTPVSASDLTVELTDKAYAAVPGNPLNRRLDFCQGLRAGMDQPFDNRFLHVEQSGERKHVAYVLVDPGIGNMDLMGDRFDGLNGSANATLPRFDHPNRPQSMIYDDRVVVAYFDQLWETLGCSANMATAGRAHPNLETTLALFKQTMVDYRTQMDIAVDMAFADNFSAGAGIASATSGLAGSGAAMLIDIASAINTAGATSGAAISAGIAIGLNAAALGVAIANQVFTVQNYDSFKSYRSAFDDLVAQKLNPLYDSVKADVARGGALVYSDK